MDGLYASGCIRVKPNREQLEKGRGGGGCAPPSMRYVVPSSSLRAQPSARSFLPCCFDCSCVSVCASSTPSAFVRRHSCIFCCPTVPLPCWPWPCRRPALACSPCSPVWLLADVPCPWPEPARGFGPGCCS